MGFRTSQKELASLCMFGYVNCNNSERRFLVQLVEERHGEILSALERDGGVVISQIAKDLQVSEMTIRRDLKFMEARGLAIRVHGGAVAPGVRFSQRLSSNQQGKARAASKLAPFVPKTGLVYLDGSTTMLSLLSRFKNAVGLQVVTNNVETFQRVTALGGVEALLVGGRLDQRTDNLVGTLALKSLEAVAFDAAFFSSRGLEPKIGPSEVTLEDAEVKNLVAGRSRAVYLAVDSTKLGVSAAGCWRSDPAATVLATDLDSDDTRLEAYRLLARDVL